MRAVSMRDHSFDVTWRFVVPPANVERLVITQRQDGPFRADTVAGRGHYYVSQERMVNGRWEHVEGSSIGALAGFADACGRAEVVWTRLREEELQRRERRAAADVGVNACTYPRCSCPFDAPADPAWCAKGLPKLVGKFVARDGAWHQVDASDPDGEFLFRVRTAAVAMSYERKEARDGSGN